MTTEEPQGIQVQAPYIIQALEQELAQVRKEHRLLSALVNQQQAQIQELIEAAASGEEPDAPTTD